MMRSLLLAALGITAFSATMAVETPEANAVVYCIRQRPRMGQVRSRRISRGQGDRRLQRRVSRYAKQNRSAGASSIRSGVLRFGGCINKLGVVPAKAGRWSHV